MKYALALALALACTACGQTGQERVTFPIHGAGTGERTFDIDGWTVTLERADVAFGPVYFCATPFADADVCPRAEAQWLGTASIDALDAEPRMLGEAEAVTATVRSAMFDYGRSWLLTEPAPAGNENALDGRSAVLVARAERDDVAIEVRAELELDPGSAGQSAVIGAPTGTHTITGGEALVVRFDLAAWWRRVDFAELAASDEDGDGVVSLARGDRAYEALVIAMTAGTLPAFEWEQP